MTPEREAARQRAERLLYDFYGYFGSNTYSEEGAIELFASALVAPPQGTAPEEYKWKTINALLEPWRKIWEGDREQFKRTFPSWVTSAAEELFAHDLCDAWAWNEYVKAASVIIARHFAARPQTAEQSADRPIKELCDIHRACVAGCHECQKVNPSPLDEASRTAEGGAQHKVTKLVQDHGPRIDTRPFPEKKGNHE